MAQDVFDPFQHIKPPFHYDDYGQMIFDSNNQMVLNVRAWGLLQKFEHGAQKQDAFGVHVVYLLNQRWQREQGKNYECPFCMDAERCTPQLLREHLENECTEYEDAKS